MDVQLSAGDRETLPDCAKGLRSESGYDELEFYLDDVLKHSISGEVDWQQKSYAVTGSGSHTLKWRYVKDSSASDGSDCGWVDCLQWSGYIPVAVPTVWDAISYTYDPAGRRIAKAYDDTTVVKYLYDGDHCIAEYDSSDQLLRKFIYGPGVDQPICMIEAADAGATYYYHFDGLGSVAALSDEDGDTVHLYEYSVYGRVAASDPNHANPFMFTGRRFDADTGLYYYRARYYNPYIGRFLQTDPGAGEYSINSYAYCKNNPTVWLDPSGEECPPPLHMGWNRPGVFKSGPIKARQLEWHYFYGDGLPLTYTGNEAARIFLEDRHAKKSIESALWIHASLLSRYTENGATGCYHQDFTAQVETHWWLLLLNKYRVKFYLHIGTIIGHGTWTHGKRTSRDTGETEVIVTFKAKFTWYDKCDLHPWRPGMPKEQGWYPEDNALAFFAWYWDHCGLIGLLDGHSSQGYELFIESDMITVSIIFPEKSPGNYVCRWGPLD